MLRQPLRVYSAAADVKHATVRALLAGKGKVPDPSRPTYATADYSGRCEKPVVIDRIGVGHMLFEKPIHTDGETPTSFSYEHGRTLSMQVRCRRCDACLKERRWMWTERAAKEWRQSNRTWFVTVTLRPEEHYKLQARVRLRLAAQGGDLDRMEPRDKLNEVLKDYKNEMRLYVNRLRIGLRTRGWDTISFRYLWVPEPHKSGAIHFHMLLHEVSDVQPIRKDRIEGLWNYGFVSAKLVKSENAARYVTKYLGKHHFEGRIAVSKHYGQRELEVNTDEPVPVFPGHVQGEPTHAWSLVQTDEQMRLELGDIPGSVFADEVTEGDPIEGCATGLHIGVPCTCKPLANAGGDPWGTERGDAVDHRGFAKRKWQLRGWHEPNDRVGRPLGATIKATDSVH